jgi:hypothetical protein
MARPSYYVETPDGKKVQLDVPANASAEQIRTLAARALKQRFPEAKYGRPALSKEASQSLIPEQARGELKADDTAISRVTGGIQGALSGLGVDERYAAHVGNRATSALNDLTPVGDAITLSDARDAWNSGNYLGAIGRGALAGVGLIPGLGDVVGGAAKAMFLGVGAKNANLEAWRRATQMADFEGADPKKIWQETGWFQGADKQWRFEVPDNEMYLDDAGEAGGSFLAENAMAGRRVPIGEVVGHKPLYEGYPTLADEVGIDRGALGGGVKGSFSPKENLVAFDESLTDPEARSTIAHELQHFVQGQEGFARGGMVGTIAARDVNPEVRALYERMSEIDKQRSRIYGTQKDWVTDKFQEQDLLDELEREREAILAKTKVLRPEAEYEGYRRLAGEVEARNVQTRLDMTPGQRLEYAPWETEDVPREDQFVIWYDK